MILTSQDAAIAQRKDFRAPSSSSSTMWV